MEGKDPIARMHIINILSKFNKPDVKRALQGQLRDTEQDDPLGDAGGAVAHGRPDRRRRGVPAADATGEIDVQNRAIDVLIRANDPETIKYLIPVLKDENEYARRAAVEVLNEIGDAKSVKYLLEAIKDDDWWVRSRAGDALGKIGGPKVIDAVLQLARDKDEDIRRAAIEILNQTKDERAVSHLIEATKRQGLVGVRTLRGRAGGDRQQARPAAPAGNAAHHAGALAAGGGARHRQARRTEEHRHAAALPGAAREGTAHRGHPGHGHARPTTGAPSMCGCSCRRRHRIRTRSVARPPARR